MSDREKLALVLKNHHHAYDSDCGHDFGCMCEAVDNYDRSEIEHEGHLADVLWAAGWRKKPSREAIARAVASGLDGWNDYDAASEDYKRELLSGADAVLALMDGPTETGEK